jgi:hypothetical protein
VLVLVLVLVLVGAGAGVLCIMYCDTIIHYQQLSTWYLPPVAGARGGGRGRVCAPSTWGLGAKPAVPPAFGSLGLWPLIADWLLALPLQLPHIRSPTVHSKRVLCPVGRAALSPWV